MLQLNIFTVPPKEKLLLEVDTDAAPKNWKWYSHNYTLPFFKSSALKLEVLQH